ncbi:hypothetical protein A2Z33_03300 [Candidatus Gottesmanbacteria bacterium RBG_16_52_11]|uniref:histidinol-phosphate transaminase n=1 Tax=Candidatus Gottesmanbacteria bacterium RBG_16_52_11 TaxID=1798374 RepID=A0A1F5YVG7_9BACT|nr:MAG: hypothetical protein A2Z33_03300 [Candidatus Gottesmanbacteria bacterium RBG_16_52_11]
MNQKIPSFRNLYAFGRKLPVDLSLSENPLGCPPGALKAISRLSRSDVFDYPDPDASLLREALASGLKIPVDMILVSNGAESIIKLIADAFITGGDEAVMPELTFPMFALAVKISGGIPVRVPMTESFDIDPDGICGRVGKRTKLVFICNPNNPTGRVLDAKIIIRVAGNISVPVVVDEANIEFGGQTVVNFTREIPNLIVLRTFSKGFGLAGMRVGFAAAGRDITERLKRIRQPFPVSAVTERVAVAGLSDTAFIRQTRSFMDRERNFLTREMRARGLRVIDSSANNLMVIVPGKSGAFVRRLEAEGVSVVDGTGFMCRTPVFIRVSPRLRSVNRKFLTAIDRIAGSGFRL